MVWTELPRWHGLLVSDEARRIGIGMVKDVVVNRLEVGWDVLRVGIDGI